MDGDITSGQDVLKAMSLIRKELEISMTLRGVSDVRKVGRQVPVS